MIDPTQSFWLADCLIEPAVGRVTCDQISTTLDAQQMRVLALLVERAGMLLTYESIERQIWPDSSARRESLYQAISQLRRALGDDPRAPRHIKTVARKGYQLVAPIRRELQRSTPDRQESPGAIAAAPSLPAAPLNARGSRLTPRALACTVVVLAAAWGILSLAQRKQGVTAARERARAEQLSQLMVGSFPLTEARPGTIATAMTATDLLAQSEQRISTDLAEQPMAQLSFLEVIGRTYRRQARYEQALKTLSRARTLYSGIEDYNPIELAKLNTQLGSVTRELGLVGESAVYFKAAADELQAADRLRSREYAWNLAEQGQLGEWRGRPEEALEAYGDAVQLMSEVEGDGSSLTAGLLASMAHVYLWIDDATTAERLARKAMSIYRTSLPPLHPDRMMGEYHLGSVLPYVGQLREAEELLQRSLANRKRVFGPHGVMVADSLRSLAELRVYQQRWTEAEDLGRQAIAAYTAVTPRPTLHLAHMETSLAVALLNQGRHREAATVLADAIDICNQAKPFNAQYAASAEHFMGEALLADNKLAAAEQALTASIEHWGEGQAPPWRIARSRNTLAEVLLRTQRNAEGTRLLLASRDQLLEDPGADLLAKTQAIERVARLMRRHEQRVAHQ